MPVRTGVICVALVPALVTLFEMAAQRRGTALFDGAQHTLLSHRQCSGMRLAKLVAMGAHNVCDFESRPHQAETSLGLWILDGVR